MSEIDREHASQHDEFALRKVDHMAGVVDERDAQGSHGIDGANSDSREQKLQKLSQHQAPTWCALHFSIVFWPCFTEASSCYTFNALRLGCVSLTRGKFYHSESITSN